MPKLTKRVVDALQPGETTRFLWDTEIKGLGFRVTPANARAFVLRYRTDGGRERKFTIGRYGVLTVETARAEARQLLADIGKGGDPVAERGDLRAGATVSDLLDRYLDEHVDKKNAETTRKEVRRIVEATIRPALGRIRISDLKRADVAKMHSALHATPRGANYALAVLSKAMSLAEVWGLRDEGANPCRKIERFAESHRERFLSMGELGRLGVALREAEAIGLPWVVDDGAAKARHLAKPENRRSPVNTDALDVVRFLLLSGARLSEALFLEWAHVDAARGLVDLPGRKGSVRKPHPVSAAALDLLAARRPVSGSPWVFPSPTDAKKPIAKSVVEHFWQRLRSVAGLDDVRLHDLRHTVGTAAGGTGANAFLIRDLLRHANVAMTHRYVNADEDPIRAVATRVGADISAALGAAATQYRGLPSRAKKTRAKPKYRPHGARD